MGHPGLGSQRKDPDREMLASAQVMAKGRARKSRAGKQGRWVTTRAPGSAKKEGERNISIRGGSRSPCQSAFGTASLSFRSRLLLPWATSFCHSPRHTGPFLVSKGPFPDSRYSCLQGEGFPCGAGGQSLILQAVRRLMLATCLCLVE